MGGALTGRSAAYAEPVNANAAATTVTCLMNFPQGHAARMSQFHISSVSEILCLSCNTLIPKISPRLFLILIKTVFGRCYTTQRSILLYNVVTFDINYLNWQLAGFLAAFSASGSR